MPATESSSSSWKREHDIQFERALATYPEDLSDRWEKIAADVSGKSLEEVKHHYELLVDDVNRIESGFIQVPCYNSSSDGSSSHGGDEGIGKKGGNLGLLNSDSNHGSKSSRSDQERRKGIAWTEDEHRSLIKWKCLGYIEHRSYHYYQLHVHISLEFPTKCSFGFLPNHERLFLLGLEKYGKGDWRSISRNFVVTRTPTQVASHAQKYFIRLNSMNKDRRRSSIHDITSVNNGDVSVPQGPITGQANGSTVGGGSSGKSNKQPPQSSGIAMYGAPTMGQPIRGPLVSAVGTPVNLPPPHLAYGVVPGAPVGPLTYPMPHPPVSR